LFGFFLGGVKFEQKIVTKSFFICLFFFVFEDGKGVWLKSKIGAWANRQHGSVEICSPAAYCVEIQEN